MNEENLIKTANAKFGITSQKSNINKDSILILDPTTTGITATLITTTSITITVILQHSQF